MTLLLLFLFIILLSCSLVAVTTYVLYWYEHEPRINTLFSSRKEALHAVGHGILTAHRALLLSVSIYLYGTMAQCCRWRLPKLPDHADRPIIMIHGLFHNSSAWVLYRHWFKKLGLTNCASFFYSSGKDFDAVSHRLELYMEEFFKKYPDAKPVLVGHSLGGLLIRNWLASSSHAHKIAGAVTLGAPMQGSRLATFSIRPLGQQLRFNGKLVQQIKMQEQEMDAISVPRYALYSPVDNMVLPQESIFTLPEGWTVVRTKPVSHIAMLSEKVIGMQVGEIAKQLLT